MSDLGFLIEGCDEHERVARLRELRALAAVYCGWDHPAKTARDRALESRSALDLALAALEELGRLPALKRRHLLASYGALMMAPLE